MAGNVQAEILSGSRVRALIPRNGRRRGKVIAARFGTEAHLDETAGCQEQIRPANEDWQLMLDTVTDAVLLLDDQRHIRYANQAAARVARVEPAQLIGKTCCEVLHGASLIRIVLAPACWRRGNKRGRRLWMRDLV